MKTNIKYILMLTLFLFVSKLNADDKIIEAMKQEIKRSMNELKLDNLQKPYFIEYKIIVSSVYDASAKLGNLIDSRNIRNAKLTVGVRVGDYKFDNTNFFDVGLSFFGSGDDEEQYKNRTIPFELDIPTLRRELWLATDAAYKQSAELFSKKEAALKNRIRKDTTWDFMALAPEKRVDTAKFPNFDYPKYKELCKELSGIFKKYPEIHVSSVNFEYQPDIIYYVNSEGMEYIKTSSFSGVEVIAATQVEDGMPIVNYTSKYALIPDNLPSKDSLIKEVVKMAETIKMGISAKPLEETYSGPVLFTNDAAAEFFVQSFAPNLVTQRKAISEGGFIDNEKSLAFQNKIGGRVMPDFMSVKAIPNTREYQSTELTGFYKIDDNGELPKDVELVKNGYLKALLSERIPTRRVRESNGHKRGGGAMFSNLVINVDKKFQLSEKQLKDKLLKLVKDRELPYGIIVKKIVNQNIMYTSLYRATYGVVEFPRGDGKMMPVEVYKLYPNGKEELVRGVELAGLNAQSFKDIINTGKNNYAYNLLAPSVVSYFMTGGSPYVSASVIVPDLLLEDAEVKIIETDFKKPPFITSPVSSN